MQQAALADPPRPGLDPKGFALKLTRLLALGGAAAGVFSDSVSADPTIGYIPDISSAFLVQNNLQSARITITGWNAGDRYQGFIGTAENPWRVITGDGSGFFNVSVDFSAESPIFVDGVYAMPSNNAALNQATGGAAPFDSGLLGGSGNNPAPANLGSPSDNDPNDNVGEFAMLLHGGSNDIDIDPVAWLSLNSAGLVPPNTLNVLRITWSRDVSATVSFVLAMNTPAGDIPMSITIPAAPAPGALALLGVAGALTVRRRRE